MEFSLITWFFWPSYILYLPKNVLVVYMACLFLQCENSLKIEAARFQEVYEKFSKERSAHLQAFQGPVWLLQVFL